MSPAAALGDVSDTARWVAHLRALESERRDALFRDVHARRLAGERGRAIAEALPRGPLSWSLAVRTRVFDDLRRFFPSGRWLLENAAPHVLARQQRRWGKALRAAHAEHKFAPAEGLAFFRPHGWVPRSTRSLLDEAQRLRRELPVVSLLRRVSPFLPFLARAYARRHAKFRDAMVYAVMEAAPPTS